MPHLNELQEQYGEAGLVVVGVTNEEPGDVEKVVERTGMKFAIARVEGDSVDRDYGIRGFPTSCVVDRQGRIAWSGHPGNLSNETLQELLAEE